LAGLMIFGGLMFQLKAVVDGLIELRHAHA
jgi:hypothetical protein